MNLHHYGQHRVKSLGFFTYKLTKKLKISWTHTNVAEQHYCTMYAICMYGAYYVWICIVMVNSSFTFGGHRIPTLLQQVITGREFRSGVDQRGARDRLWARARQQPLQKLLLIARVATDKIGLTKCPRYQQSLSHGQMEWDWPYWLYQGCWGYIPKYVTNS